ncbi:ABC transporter ATP-binding protein [Granulicella sibirica]|uniref:ABC transporter related n=1 Tax=Granulicella sibirica TaxID=2479048 RepID=A0A4Q0T5L9_9BACT|nr:ABC transporter ATP-binding protein [Granulicella sibirica]RXH56916.1 ABC transporter related [Granulicella sibirica]
MTPLLELHTIAFAHPAREVLRNISLAIEEGTATALIGPNGIGKTTLLRLASGAITPAHGEVFFNGKPLRDLDRRQRAQSVALVPQRLEVPFRFTVQQIVEQGRTPYVGYLRGLLREDRLAVDRALDLAHVTSLRHRIFNELSGGERQRVKIALGLAQQPKLLLLDEPTQNLDIGRQVELIDLLHLLRSEGITIFASIHDLHLVPNNFSTVLLLGPDHRLLEGSPADIMTSEHLQWAFDYPASRHLFLPELLVTKETR